MKLIVSNGETFKDRLQNFPWAGNFAPSKILVVGMNDGSIIATCGIRSVLNILTLYVGEGYRGQRIGMRILKETIEAARKRNLSFIVLCVLKDNMPALHLYLKSGFREIVRFEKSILMMFPLTTRGKLVYSFLSSISPKLPALLIVHVANWIEKKTTNKN